MTKTSKTEMTKKGRALMSPEGKRPDGTKAQRALGADLTAILEKVLRQAKKARWGDGLESCFLTDGFTLIRTT
ncbi:hypothetical protein PYV50_05135 [Pseudomonas sp. H22_DOA]|nr:hypothetical protein PYV50_05135 [Pseudomonas sp. H22_DOA]